ncbi:NeuD/PglB/VioB family sugar acetyltransferase [Mesorhizobium sp. 1B3]|uniref:NeuD/PglB/VioB family sugar acetyltransferase n=1 Tax=Mesorhizobium sp. 1B3 TaxID=3243599 RepID=UPI003D96ECAB
MVEEFIIYGSGGHAREVLFQMRADGYDVVAMVDDRNPGGDLHQLPILSSPEARASHPHALWVVAIGNPATRRRVTVELASHGVKFGSYISRRAFIAPTAVLHHPVQIFANAVLSDLCVVRSGAIVHFGCVICHDSIIGEYSTVCPGVTIAGNVAIGNEVWVGVGSSFRDGTTGQPLVVGDGAFVGAGSCVVGPIAAGTLVVGVPARPKVSGAV